MLADNSAGDCVIIGDYGKFTTPVESLSEFFKMSILLGNPTGHRLAQNGKNEVRSQ